MGNTAPKQTDSLTDLHPSSPAELPSVWYLEDGICLASWNQFCIGIYQADPREVHTVIFDDILWHVQEQNPGISIFSVVSGVPVPSASERHYILNQMRSMGSRLVSASFVLLGGGYRLKAQRAWHESTQVLAGHPNHFQLTDSLKQAAEWQASRWHQILPNSIDPARLHWVIRWLNDMAKRSRPSEVIRGAPQPRVLTP